MHLRVAGYSATYEWIPSLALFVAEMDNTPYVISFCASSKAELEQLMLQCIDQLEDK